MTQTATKSKEISLLLTPENRQAVRSGIKTQTRRILKLKDPLFLEGLESFYEDGGGNWMGIACPYGKKGDRFYLLEPTQVLHMGEGKQVLVQWLDSGESAWVDVTEQDIEKLQARKDWSKPCSSRFMLKSFSRNWFVNDGVRVQRVQEISEEDAKAEGIERLVATKERFGCRAAGMLLYRNYLDFRDPWKTGFDNPIDSFKTLWNSINSDRGYDWDSNLWVWCISFRRAEE